MKKDFAFTISQKKVEKLNKSLTDQQLGALWKLFYVQAENGGTIPLDEISKVCERVTDYYKILLFLKSKNDGLYFPFLKVYYI